MAIDTKDKRFSMLGFSDGAVLMDPDSSVDEPDRAHLLHLYVGISLTGGAQNLIIADGVHAHSADNLSLQMEQVLVIDDALHSGGAEGGRRIFRPRIGVPL